MSDHIHWRCLECDTAGETKPTKTTIGRAAEKHVEDTQHAVTTSLRPVPAWFSGGRLQLVKGDAA